MTALGSRVAMRHRVTTQRQAAGSNSWGQPSGNWTNNLTNQPCRCWDVSAQLVIAPGEIAPVQQRKLALPLGTDILDTDRIGDVTYRGAVVFEGPMTIDQLDVMADRIELTLRRSS